MPANATDRTSVRLTPRLVPVRHASEQMHKTGAQPTPEERVERTNDSKNDRWGERARRTVDCDSGESEVDCGKSED